MIGPVTVKETFTHVNEGGIVCVTGLLGNQWTLEHFDPITDIAPGAYLTGGYSGSGHGRKRLTNSSPTCRGIR